MQYKIKNFRNEGDNKYVGLFVINEAGNKFAIDKQVPLVDGETDAYYVQQAITMSQPEIDEWNSQFKLVGRTFDPETGEFESNEVVEQVESDPAE